MGHALVATTAAFAASLLPVVVPSAAAAPPLPQLSAGGGYTCGVKADATVACWGANDHGQAAAPAGAFTQVAAGATHTCGVKTDSTVVCWGLDGAPLITSTSPPSGAAASPYVHTFTTTFESPGATFTLTSGACRPT